MIFLRLFLVILNSSVVQSFQAKPLNGLSMLPSAPQHSIERECKSLLLQVKTTYTPGQITLNMGDGNNENDREAIPFLASAVGATMLLAAWPLLTLLRDTNSPTDGFDVDMFMTLKGMLENNGGSGGDMSMPTDEKYASIVELPALSPAEQLVGTVFGPPR